MRPRSGALCGLIALSCLACAAWLPAGEAPPPTPEITDPAAPTLPVESTAPTAAAPTPEELTALSKTVRFLDAFPGSPADREELLKQYWAALNGNLDPNTPPVEVWAHDPIGEWMHGPVPTRITPTMMLLAWQKVISEHYGDTALTFAPRLRTWCLRVLDRIGARRDALAGAIKAADADKKLEHARLTDMAVAFRQAVLMLPGPGDRTQGLPVWTTALPAPREPVLGLTVDAADYGITPHFSNNLAAEQTCGAIEFLQRSLELRGAQRMTWGPSLTGMLFQDREDARLFADLGRWIDEYTVTAALDNDLLSLASMAQAPRDPEALKVWEDDLNKRYAARLEALRAAGCDMAHSNPHQEGKWDDRQMNRRWTLLPLRSGPMDLPGLAGIIPMPADLAEARLTMLTPARWEALFAGDSGLQNTPGADRPATQFAVRAVLAMQGESTVDRLLALGLLEPVHFLRGPGNPAPLRDDEALGPVWIDGGRDFYTALSRAALAHSAYLRRLQIAHANADQFAELCDHLAGWAVPADRVKPVGVVEPRTDLELRQLLYARQWLAAWLQIELSAQSAPREAVLAGRYRVIPHGSVAFVLGQQHRCWTMCYAVRPGSQSGLETPDRSTGSLLTVGIEFQPANRRLRTLNHRWTAAALTAAVTGPEGKGPLRYFDLLLPSQPAAGAVFAQAWAAGVTPELRALTLPARRKLFAWVSTDPAGFAAALEDSPYRRDGDFDRLLTAALSSATENERAAVTALVKELPDHAAAIYGGLVAAEPPQAALLEELAKQTETQAAERFLADPRIPQEVQARFLAWRMQQPAPAAIVGDFLAQSPDVLQPALEQAQDPVLPLLRLAWTGWVLDPWQYSFRQRIEQALQLGEPVAIRNVAPANRPDPQQARSQLIQAATDPALQPSALAAMAMCNQEAVYPTLENAWIDPAADRAAMLPPHVYLLGTSRVTGPRPERGRELLRAWVRRPAMDADGRPRAPSLQENQTWALAVDLLEREYILNDEDLPALVERYIQEIGADVIAPRMRFPTHGAFATAFFINPERTLDRIVAALGSEDRFRRDAALAILTTQIRVDALNGERPVELPALENLPLRLENVPETQRQQQVVAWFAWFNLRRGAILEQIRGHLE